MREEREREREREREIERERKREGWISLKNNKWVTKRYSEGIYCIIATRLKSCVKFSKQICMCPSPFKKRVKRF